MLKMSFRHSNPPLYVCVLRECVMLTSACGFFVAGRLPASAIPSDMPPPVVREHPAADDGEAHAVDGPAQPQSCDRIELADLRQVRNRDSNGG